MNFKDSLFGLYVIIILLIGFTLVVENKYTSFREMFDNPLVYHARIPPDFPDKIQEGRDYVITNSFRAKLNKDPIILYVDHDLRMADKLVIFKNEPLNQVEYAIDDVDIFFRDSVTLELFQRYLSDLFLPYIRRLYSSIRVKGVMPIQKMTSSSYPILWIALTNENTEYSDNPNIRVLDYMSVVPTNTFQKISMRLPFVRKTAILFKDLISSNNVIPVAQDVQNFTLQTLAFDRVVYTGNSASQSPDVIRLISESFISRSWQPQLDRTFLEAYSRFGFRTVQDISQKTERIEAFTDVSHKRITIKVPMHLEMHPEHSSLRLPVFRVKWPLIQLGIRPRRGDSLHIYRQSNSFENGIYRIHESFNQDRDLIIAQVHVIPFFPRHMSIKEMSLDQKSFDLEVSRDHPYVKKQHDIMWDGDICFVKGQFDMYGFIVSQKNTNKFIHIHLFDDEYVFRNDYECVGDNSKNSEKQCESTHEYDQRLQGTSAVKNESNIWDRRCANDFDCPFLQKAKNEKGYDGGCTDNGYCKMPFNVKRKGFRHYILDNTSFPICKGCEEYLADSQKMQRCCEENQDNFYVF